MCAWHVQQHETQKGFEKCYSLLRWVCIGILYNRFVAKLALHVSHDRSHILHAGAFSLSEFSTPSPKDELNYLRTSTEPAFWGLALLCSWFSSEPTERIIHTFRNSWLRVLINPSAGHWDVYNKNSCFVEPDKWKQGRCMFSLPTCR